VTVYLAFEHVLAINEQVTGGRFIRDAGIIDSACGRPRATVFGEDAYPSIWEKAAALMQSLACNHGFVDGNKRTAWIAVTAFLDANGHPLDASFSDDAAEEFVLAVATGAMPDVPAIANALVKFTH
jgi:death on curing protein